MTDRDSFISERYDFHLRALRADFSGVKRLDEPYAIIAEAHGRAWADAEKRGYPIFQHYNLDKARRLTMVLPAPQPCPALHGAGAPKPHSASNVPFRRGDVIRFSRGRRTIHLWVKEVHTPRK